MIIMILERHFQGQRQAVVLLADTVAGQCHVGLARFVAGVAVLGLEVFGGALQMAAEMLFELFDPWRVAWITFATGSEYVRNFLITMDVEEQVDAVLFHLLLNEQHFRAVFLTGALP